MLRKRRERRERPGRFKLHKAPWVDPFPWIPGTEPEKRIFAALVERRIYFRYQAPAPIEIGQLTLMKSNYIPDFQLPEYRVVIDPFSPYHHSLPGAIKRDGLKIGMFLAAGWEYYHPWAQPDGQFTLDQPQHQLGLRERVKGQELIKYRRNSKGRYRRDKDGNIIPIMVDAKGGDLFSTGRAMSAAELLRQLPMLNQGPRFDLVDPEDKKAKRERGYLIGSRLGAGATSVAAANRRRRVIVTIRNLR